MKRPFLYYADQIVEKIISAFSVIGAVLMVLLTMVVFGEIVSRYFFGLPITFSSELTTIFFPWIVFLMLVEVTKKGEHIAIAFFQDLAPKNLKKAMVIITHFIMLFFSVFITVSSYDLCVASKSITLPVLRFMTKVYQYSAITLSFSLITFVLVIKIVKLFIDPAGAAASTKDGAKEKAL